MLVSVHIIDELDFVDHVFNLLFGRVEAQATHNIRNFADWDG